VVQAKQPIDRAIDPIERQPELGVRPPDRLGGELDGLQRRVREVAHRQEGAGQTLADGGLR
jgi:hypothetical protein